MRVYKTSGTPTIFVCPISFSEIIVNKLQKNFGLELEWPFISRNSHAVIFLIS
jgi:hypothetical protein